MGRIRFKHYYTEVVEHFFRMSVRYKKVSESTPQDWFIFTNTWIDMQSDEDKKFIRFVFDYRFRTTLEGLACFESELDLYLKRERLALLEKQYAIDAGLISEEYDNDRRTES